MTTAQIVVLIVIVVLAVLIIGGAAWLTARRRSLRARFGPEYDRVVVERNSRIAAERELRDRERRYAELQLRELTPEARARYEAQWADLQARFVDAPNQMASQADELVTRLAAERGYPTDDYDERLATLSVEHAGTLGRYRDAHAVSLKNQRGEATTEELRQAMVHYRALFTDLLGEYPVDAYPEPAAEAGYDGGNDPADDPGTRAGDRVANEPVRETGRHAAHDTSRR